MTRNRDPNLSAQTAAPLFEPGRKAYAATARATTAKAPAMISGAPPVASLRRLRVLVVEDDLIIGEFLAELLEELGHAVCAVAIDAIAATAAARRCQPDLMIVDIGLGATSGIAAVREILGEGFVPHVFVTGDVLLGQSLEPDAVMIQKPYRSLDLVAAIERAIGRRPTRDPPSSA